VRGGGGEGKGREDEGGREGEPAPKYFGLEPPLMIIRPAQIPLQA